jgi:hypothetical protein
MVPAETTPGTEGGREWRKMVEEVNSCMIYLIPSKNLCKCHNVPSPNTKGKRVKKPQKTKKEVEVPVEQPWGSKFKPQ